MNRLQAVIRRLSQNLTKNAWGRFTYYPVLFLVAAAALALLYWDQLSDLESESATIRNFAIVLFAVVGLGLAIWRGAVLDRQADTAQQSLLNERYQKGAEMLGSDLLSVRLGGIYALKFLAREHPKQYHVLIMQLLCGFVRYPPEEKNKLPTSALMAREDVLAAMQAIGERNESHIALERDAEYVPNLQGADLRKQILNKLNLSGIHFLGAKFSGAYLYSANFSGADCFGADFCNAKLPGADFSGASLLDANLSGTHVMGGSNFSDANLSSANLTDANLSGAIFTGAQLTGTNLSGTVFHKNGLLAEGLTQRQIAFAKANPMERPPTIDGLKDADTGELIEWSKRPKIK